MLDLIASLPRPSHPDLRYTTRDQWHVTLRFLGEADMDTACRAVHEVQAPRAEAVLGSRIRRFGATAIALTVDGLAEVASAVCEATASVGTPPETRPFEGHLTLGRVRARSSRWAMTVPGTFAASPARAFTVDEIELIRSTGGRGGVAYTTEAVVPLG